MSKITPAYDALLLALSTLMPGKIRIPNPYNLTQNPKQFLTDSYGLKVGPSDPQVFEFNTMTITRRFSVVIAREVFKKDIDVDIADDASKLILEDVYAIQNLLYSYTDANILKIDLNETSEITSVNVDKQDSLSIEVSFTAWVSENI